MSKFKPVQSMIDFPKMEEELLNDWYASGVVDKYITKNKDAKEKFSFLDGPITANNPMGVHHAWGRTYKDLWQRYFTMRGRKQRYQNGFDEQGLWVEVEVEKELGLKTKRDIENLVPGDIFKSIEQFVNLCKERVKKFSGVQTEQSKRLGYFMDWGHSYHTSSDENNYAIWQFLKVVHEKSWLYKGHDSVPWCPRCGTAISQHEILTEDYKELTHTSVYLRLPIEGRKNEYLLVWTTTPWTIPGNVAVGINPEIPYLAVKQDENIYYLAETRKEILRGDYEIIKKVNAKELIGLHYRAAFGGLPRVKNSVKDYVHTVVEAADIVTADEGTGLLHVAPGAGEEDFHLAKAINLPVIELIDESANYLVDMGEFSFQNAKQHPELILDYLQEQQKGAFLYTLEDYTHRYPICWRCKSELVWRVVDEWYIAMDKKDDSGKTYREQMKQVNEHINWIPKWGKERELDWLSNLHDWLISKERYWGLALPIWECSHCGSFDVIGSRDELKGRAVEGWGDFDGHTPHRPWIDQVKIKCSSCGNLSTRVTDVGNVWLDAGIVTFSTMSESWRPADFITESFPGQFKNWFYSLIAMGTVLAKAEPTKSILGFASVVDEKGEPMHKSKGNSIEFNEAAAKVGVDSMRWAYVTQNPELNLKFGYNVMADIKKRFYLILWNSYKYFIDYATLANWQCEATPQDIDQHLSMLDRWILARLTEVVLLVNKHMEMYDAATASRAIEDFVVNDLSTWYIRRSRDRVGPSARPEDQTVFLSTLYGVLVTLTKLLAPFMPFVTETMYRNLTGDLSVHLADYPLGDKKWLDKKLVEDMTFVRHIVELGHAKRKEAQIKVRQPLASLEYSGPEDKAVAKDLQQIIAQELNVKQVSHKPTTDKNAVIDVILDTKLTNELREEGEARELIRQIQIARKEADTNLTDTITVYTKSWPKQFEDEIKKQTLAKNLVQSDDFRIERA